MKITEEVVEAVKGLEDRRGRLTPDEVVDAARAEDSPLHSFFEWDDSAAAEEWRKQQARELIRRIKIVVTVENISIRVPKYIPDRETGPTEQGYIDVARIKRRTLAMTIASELTNARGLLDRSRTITAAREAELPAGILSRIESIIGLVDQLIEELD